MAEPIIHHRTPEYEEMFNVVNEGLRYLFQTGRDVFTLSSSGTGAMEACVVNVLSKGDKALVMRGGKFGERWGEICEAYCIETVNLDFEWGTAINPDDVARALKENPDIKAVFSTQSETSTGVLTDMKALGEVVSPTDAILVTDAVSGIGVHELLPDSWGIDIVAAGSQKSIMLPPGLAFVAVTQKAWECIETPNLPKYYWDLKKYKKSLAKNQNPFTPPVTLMAGLRECLEMIRSEGLEQMQARHRLMAEAARAGVKALGIEIFAKSPSNVLTALSVPAELDGKKLLSSLKRNGIFAAGGQAQLAGKIIRISHLGYTDIYDILTAMAGLERSLSQHGWSFEKGASLKAAQEVLLASE